MTRNRFLALFIVAAALRLFAIWRAPLWYDENFTLLLARLPLDQLMQATAGDVHPPLWYLIEWAFFHAFPAAPVWMLRLPAAAFSLLALYTLYRLCHVIKLPARVETLALIFMAIMPFQIWYAQEGRMYALLEFLVLYALYAGLTRRWVWFTLAAIAMTYTQNYGILYMVTIAIVLFIEDRAVFSRVALAGLLTILAYLPWYTVMQSQMSTIEGRYWIMDDGPGAVLNAIYKQFWASAMLEPGVFPSYVLTFAALSMGVIAITRVKHPAAGLVIAMAFMPVLLSWVISVFWQPILLFRPLIGISPFLYILAAFAFEPPAEASPDSAMRQRLVFTIFAAPLFMFGIAGYYQNIQAMKGEGAVSSMLEAFAYVRANWQEGDVLYYTDDGPMINIMPYAVDMPQYKLPACDERVGYAPVLGSLSDTTRAALGIAMTNLQDVDYTRAWVFAPRSPLHPLCYEEQIKDIAPEGEQVLTVDDNEFIDSGVWLIENQ